MAKQIDNSNTFYLGFNKHTGQLVDVIAPEGRNVKLHPRKAIQLSLGQLDPAEEKEVLIELKNFNALIKDKAMPFVPIILVDEPNSSPCGGSCGGIPFSWC